jgi:hypothetical protein
MRFMARYHGVQVECTPCLRSSRHIARHKQGLYPGGQHGVQYIRLRDGLPANLATDLPGGRRLVGGNPPRLPIRSAALHRLVHHPIDTAPELTRLTEHDLFTWRQHMMMQGGLKAASINRRLEAVRRLLRWAKTARWRATSPSTSSRFVSSASLDRLVSQRHRCMACCAPLARVLMGSPGAITLWSNSCCRPDYGSARCHHCGVETLCFVNVLARSGCGMAKGSRNARCR